MGIQFKYEPPKINAAALLHERIEFAEDAAAHVLLDAAKELVPEDSGELKGSGIVIPTPTGAIVHFSAVNDEDDYDYATRQHEDENLHHPNGGQAHYLSDPMHKEGAAMMAAAIPKLRF